MILSAMSADASMPTASSNSVLVSFFTTTFPIQAPEQSFSIPLSTLPEGLNLIIRSILSLPENDGNAFDFLHNDEYIGSSLESFLRRRRANFEELLHIEYTPALQAQEGSKLPHDDWVSSLRAPVLNNSTVLLTAAYDHCVRLWSGDECLALGAMHTEAVKELALHPNPSAALESAVRSDNSKKKSSGAKRKTDLPDMCFISGGKDAKIGVWRYASDSGSLQCISSIAAHIASVDTVCIQPVSGALLASGSWDTTVKVFEWSVEARAVQYMRGGF